MATQQLQHKPYRAAMETLDRISKLNVCIEYHSAIQPESPAQEATCQQPVAVANDDIPLWSAGCLPTCFQRPAANDSRPSQDIQRLNHSSVDTVRSQSDELVARVCVDAQMANHGDKVPITGRDRSADEH